MLLCIETNQPNIYIYICEDSFHLLNNPNFVAELTALTNFAGITSLVYAGGEILLASVSNEPISAWLLFSANQNIIQTGYVLV